MKTDVKFNLIIIDLLDLYYTTYSDILINKDKYKLSKNLSPVICFNLMLRFLRNLEENNSYKDVKYFFFIKEHDIKSIDLKKIKISISKREKNIDFHFEYFFNIFLYILKNYKDNYYIIYNNAKLLDQLISMNKDKKVLLVSKKMNKCHYLMEGDDIYWYNYSSLHNKEAFVSNYKFIPTQDKVELYLILNKKPAYRTKLYKYYSISSDLSVNIVNTFNSFEDFYKNYSYVLPDETKKKIYSSMKILLINKQSPIDKDYSTFDLDENYIYSSKYNNVALNMWKKILRIDL